MNLLGVSFLSLRAVSQSDLQCGGVYRDINKGCPCLIRGHSLFLYSLNRYTSSHIFFSPTPSSSMVCCCLFTRVIANYAHIYNALCFTLLPLCSLSSSSFPIPSSPASCLFSLCSCMFSYPFGKWSVRSNV